MSYFAGMPGNPFFDRDLSWLTFNCRVPAIAELQKIKATKDDYRSPEGLQLLTRITARLNTRLDHFGRLLSGRLIPALEAGNPKRDRPRQNWPARLNHDEIE